MANPATRTAPGDITAPPVPSAPTVVPYGRGLQVSVVGYTPPTDFFRYRYFKNGVVWRESPTLSQIDYDVSYGVTYQYTVAAIDTALPANVSTQSGIGSGIPQPYTTPDHADGSITTAKIAVNAITSGGQINSTTRIFFGSGSPGPAPVDMPGMTLTLTTVGGVCQVFVTVVLYVQNFAAVLANVGGVILVQRDAVTVSPTFFTSFTATALGSTGDWNYMTVTFSFLDLPAAGSHTWKILWGVGMGTISMDALNRNLTVVEFRR